MTNVNQWFKKAFRDERNDVALVVQGPQASGKTTLVNMLMKFTVCDVRLYRKGPWNNHLLADFVVCDEGITPDDLDEWIEEDVVTINQMAGPSCDLPNRANWIILTHDATPWRERHLVVNPVEAIAAFTHVVPLDTYHTA